ncbi:MAG: hypothetical protein LUI87_12060 [Lachnospiraceae bacterium]|nr:hypothetical protein [Lachnospiraceae bacterium]
MRRKKQTEKGDFCLAAGKLDIRRMTVHDLPARNLSARSLTGWNSFAWKGSYTVEAALVVSITFLVLASLVIGTFYLHDRVVFQSMVCEIASAGSACATESERKSAVSVLKGEVSASRFLGSRDISGSASVGENEVTASWSAGYPVPGFAMNYLAGNELPIEVSWTSKIVEPVDTIRLIRGAGELITEGDN